MAQEAEWSEPFPGYRWLLMSLWQVCMVSGFAVVATLGILLPSISSDLGLSPSQQGLLGSAAVWGNLGLAIPVGWWMSRYRPKMVLTVTQVVGTLFIFLQGWAGSFTILLLGRLALGMSLILRGPAKAMLTQQWFSQREIPLVNSASNAIFNLVVAGGLLTTPFILKTLGDDWRKTFYVFAVFFAVLTVLWAVLGRERGSTDYRTSKFSDEVAVLKRALSYRDVWLAGVGFAGATVAEGAFFTFFPTLMLDNYGVSLKWSGGITALYLFVAACSGFGVVLLATSSGRGKTLLRALGVLTAGTFIGMTMTGSIPLLVALALLNGIGWGFWPLLTSVPYLLPGVRPREAAIGVSFVFFSVSTGTAIGPMVVGFLREATGDLRLAMLIVSFAPLSVTFIASILGANVIRVPTRPGEVRSR